MLWEKHATKVQKNFSCIKLFQLFFTPHLPLFFCARLQFYYGRLIHNLTPSFEQLDIIPSLFIICDRFICILHDKREKNSNKVGQRKHQHKDCDSATYDSLIIIVDIVITKNDGETDERKVHTNLTKLLVGGVADSHNFLLFIYCLTYCL